MIIEGEEEYQVEAIRADRIRYRKQQFLVKWEGYGEDENTWEPAEHLENAGEALAEYRAKRKKCLPAKSQSAKATRRST